MKTKISIAGIVIVICIATILTYIATRNGLCLAIDGYWYLYMARFIKRFWRISSLSTFDKTLFNNLLLFYGDAIKSWPPFYSILLAITGWTSDPYKAGRLLHLIFPGSIGFMICLLFRQHQKSYARSFFAISLILVSPPIVYFNCFVLSESLFIFLQLLIMITISHYLNSQNNLFLFLSAFFVCIACMTKYFGIAVVPALAIMTWYANRKSSFFRCFSLCILCVLVSALPVIVFMVLPIGDNTFELVGGRPLFLKTPNLLLFTGVTLQSIIQYLSPLKGPFLLKIIFASGVASLSIMLVIWELRHQLRYPPSQGIIQLQLFIGLCIIGYFFMVLLLSFLYHDNVFNGLNTRYLAPLFMWAVILIGVMGADESCLTLNRSFKRFFFSFIFFILIAVYLYDASWMACKINKQNEYSTKLWKGDTVWHYIHNTSNTSYILSNEPSKVSHYAGIPAFLIPNRYFLSISRSFNTYEEHMYHLKQMLKQNSGVVLYFNPYLNEQPEISIILGSPSVEECIQLLDLEIVARTENCLILRPKS
ncbi:MAG: hypothetical protein AB1724_16685 [Thermodesulfobacteriota bacterium]